MTDDERTDRDVRIRPVHDDELDELKLLDEAIFEDLAYPYFVLRQFFDMYREFFLVVAHPSGLRGYSLSVPTFDRKLAWGLGLGVRPEYQGLGYGRLLAVASTDLLRSVDVHEVYLSVEPHNDRALALYTDLGFTVMEYRRDYFGPSEDRIVMVATLA